MKKQLFKQNIQSYNQEKKQIKKTIQLLPQNIQADKPQNQKKPIQSNISFQIKQSSVQQNQSCFYCFQSILNLFKNKKQTNLNQSQVPKPIYSYQPQENSKKQKNYLKIKPKTQIINTNHQNLSKSGTNSRSSGNTNQSSSNSQHLNHRFKRIHRIRKKFLTIQRERSFTDKCCFIIFFLLLFLFIAEFIFFVVTARSILNLANQNIQATVQQNTIAIVIVTQFPKILILLISSFLLQIFLNLMLISGKKIVFNFCAVFGILIQITGLVFSIFQKHIHAIILFILLIIFSLAILYRINYNYTQEFMSTIFIIKKIVFSHKKILIIAFISTFISVSFLILFLFGYIQACTNTIDENNSNQLSQDRYIQIIPNYATASALLVIFIHYIEMLSISTSLNWYFFQKQKIILIGYKNTLKHIGSLMLVSIIIFVINNLQLLVDLTKIFTKKLVSFFQYLSNKIIICLSSCLSHPQKYFIELNENSIITTGMTGLNFWYASKKTKQLLQKSLGQQQDIYQQVLLMMQINLFVLYNILPATIGYIILYFQDKTSALCADLFFTIIILSAIFCNNTGRILKQCLFSIFLIHGFVRDELQKEKKLKSQNQQINEQNERSNQPENSADLQQTSSQNQQNIIHFIEYLIELNKDI